ncbi:pre-mRNA-splicing factor Rse1p [[Candida] anglica]|uniref:Pre-mRNA-splicing factor Rse1p n=1 Tax=[Candida] anglica TaxID=148631 RepID=A0ABP0EHN9_9ASCO
MAANECASLYLYQLTLRKPSHSVAVVVGSFTGSKKLQDVVVANSTNIEVWRPDTDSGKISKVASQDTWAKVQALDTFRVPGSSVDFLVVTSDSGKLVILKFDVTTSRFVPLVQEPHSKTGFRRTTPGEYLAVDPQGRAIMISALERNKLCYTIKQAAASDSNASEIELLSPLESISKKILTLDMVALDTGYDNPVFAAIECDYSEYSTGSAQYDPESSPLLLQYYELDQALNHVVKRKSKLPLPASASKIIPLPSQVGGGSLVCCEEHLIYESTDGEKRLYLPIPQRSEDYPKLLPTRIVNYVVHKMKKNAFFILVQSNLGDCFKITVDYDTDRDLFNAVNMTYFDTIPLCHTLNVLKSGFLLANCENNNKQFYQFENLGEDVNETTMTTMESLPSDENITRFTVFEEPTNLSLVDTLESLNPVIGATLVETTSALNDDPVKQLVTLSSHAYLKTLTHGLPTSTVVSSPLPFKPTSIYTTKLQADSTNDDYLVISSTLSSQTLILSIGEVVEEVTDSQFVATQPTIDVQQVGKNSVIQIYPNGIRHVRNTPESSKTTDWYPPAGINIISASSNNEQVIIGLSNREICYFEVDPTDDQLIEYQERIEMGGAITAVAIASSSEKTKSPFAVVGCADETITVLSLQQHNCLGTVTLQALSSNSSSIIMLRGTTELSIHIGMENGLYVRTVVDEVTGRLSDTRTRYLGSKSVDMSVIGLPDSSNQSAVLAISSRPWIGYTSNDGYFKLTPLMDVSVTNGASFFSEDIGGQGIVGIADNDLVIFTVGSEGEPMSTLEDDFSISSVKLRYTPRKMVTLGETVYIIESEYGSQSSYPISVLETVHKDEHDETEYQVLPINKPLWSSCIQIAQIASQEVIQSVELSNNERAVSLSVVNFSNSDQEHLVVGTTENEVLLSKDDEHKSFLYTFKIDSKSKRLSFVYRTEVDFKPTVLCEFDGKLLVGMQNYLRIYDMGQRQLLRKTSTQIDYFKTITAISVNENNRLVVADISQSTSFVKYDSTINQFVPFADDIMKRQITSMISLDYSTVVGGDKFGNIFVSRLPDSISDKADNDWSSLKFQPPYLNSSGSRLKSICEFHLGDIPTSFTKGCLNVDGVEALIFTGLQGSVGILVPVATKQETDFFVKLEIALREYFNYNFDDFSTGDRGYNILGRDHLKFRGYYNPSKNVIDGDLIEKFTELNQSAKIKISGSLDRTPKDVEKKIAEMRNRSAF